MRRPDGLWTLGFAEPANALSLPTWVIHVSSLLEWLVAMGLVWRLGIASGNRAWQSLTWCMIPSHTSGICACVYHFFYNAPSVGYVVLLQALLTLIGNTTLAYGAYRVASSNGWTLKAALPFGGNEAAVTPPVYAPGEVDAAPENALLTVFLYTVVGSYLIKYGETLLPFTLNDDFAPSAHRRLTSPRRLPTRSLTGTRLCARAVGAALLIAAPTALNVWKWSERSKEGAENFEGII